jgi:NADPH:quinone reductase-like Zn-dependent oxidoreductase
MNDKGYATELCEAGKIVPVIDRCYPLRETVDAFRHVMENHAQGKVVVTVEHPAAR